MQPRHLRVLLILLVFAVLITSHAGVKAWSNLALFTITGNVTNDAGQPVSGVTINLTGYQTATTQTSGAGSFAFASLSPSGNYTVRPFKENFYFTPRAKIYNSLTQNELANFVAHTCSYTHSSAGQNFAAAGGTGQVSLTANDVFCSWTATSNVPWLRITSSTSGNGNSLIRFVVDPSTTTRSGALTIGGLSFEVNQTGCTYTLTPSQQSFTAIGGNGAITVSALESFCPWTATSNVAWINITSGNNGTGNGTMTYTVSPTTLARSGILTVAGISFAVWQEADRCQSLGFGPPIARTLGIQPTDVATADFNGDSKGDLVILGRLTSGNQSPVYSILLSTGDGTFTQSTGIISDFEMTVIAIGDFNNDTKLDLAFSSNFGRLMIRLGDGTGGFQQSTSVDTTLGYSRLVAGDFDRDGNLDLVGALGNDDRFRLLRGNGNGTFVLTGTIYQIGGRTRTLVKGDFNGDGFLDLAIGSEEPFPGQGRLSYMLGNGAGAFSTPVHIPLGASIPVEFTTGDFNGDGRTDLVSNGLSLSQVLVFTWNPSTNGFNSPVIYFTDAFVAGRFAVGDVNGDAKPDIVTAASGSFVFKIAVLLGNGDGTFASPVHFVSNEAVSKLVLADFNGDKRLDLATAKNDSVSSDSVWTQLNTCPAVNIPRTPFDFDGDGKSDVSVFRPSNGFWYIVESSSNAFRATAFGLSSDRIAPGDYDGDRKTDLAVFRASTGFWYVLRSTDNSIQPTTLGQIDDIPTPGDFDGDGKADIAIFRPSNNAFNILFSSDGSSHTQQWGQSGDLPVIGDYDGDKKTDLAIFRPSTSTFYILLSSNGTVRGQQFGQAGDKPVGADVDGDGKTDIAVYRPSNGAWYQLFSSDNSFHSVLFGANGDIPSAGDYDGDYKWDVAVFRPSTGAFYILQSTNNALRVEQFGANGDIPIASAFVP